jgi:alanine racemase
MSFWHELNRIGLYIPLKHCANSAALLRFPKTHLDIVRPGIALYGLYPWGDASMPAAVPVSLRPAMTLKATISMIKEVEPGTAVSYGRKYMTARPARIAVVSIGYADGFTRNLGNQARVLAGGGSAPVTGAICMDQCMVDVTDVPGNLQPGDEVTVMGCRDGQCIPAEEIAGFAGTINYEVVSLIGRRIPRVYTRNGRIVQVVKYII